MARRPQQEEIDLGKAPGVAVPKDKKLDKLGADFIAIRDQKAELAEELTAIETKILDRMAELGFNRYRFADQEMTLKNGKTHVKARKVKLENDEHKEEQETVGTE